jgi:hypothetical protein
LIHRGRARYAAQARPRRSAGGGSTTESAHRGARHHPGGDAAAGCSTAPPRPLRSAPCWRSARPRAKSGKLQIWPIVRQGRLPKWRSRFSTAVADPATLANQVKKLKDRFALERVVLVGDRGMITEARIQEVCRARLDHHVAGASAPSQRPAAWNCPCLASAISPPSRRRIIRASAGVPPETIPQLDLPRSDRKHFGPAPGRL